LLRLSKYRSTLLSGQAGQADRSILKPRDHAKIRFIFLVD